MTYQDLIDNRPFPSSSILWFSDGGPGTPKRIRIPIRCPQLAAIAASHVRDNPFQSRDRQGAEFEITSPDSVRK